LRSKLTNIVQSNFLDWIIKNCVHSRIICAINLANATFWSESKQTYDHLLYTSINTIKYLKGLHGGWIGPHVSHWILSRKDSDSITTFDGDGLIINLPWEHAAHRFSLGKKIFRFFKGCQCEFLIIRRIIIDPGCPSWSCQNINIFGSEHFWCITKFISIDFMIV
jgi:hypothetical protein